MDYNDSVPLPEYGMILFMGDTGEVIRISRKYETSWRMSMNYKCLIVDDDLTIAETTTEYFNVFDVKTAFVTSYDDALDFLSKNEVSLILLDINLDGKSGFDLCRKIREEFDMPILFISARKSDDNILMALNIGGDDYISKPFSLNILLAKARTILARYEKAAEAVKSAAGQWDGEKQSAEEGRYILAPGLYLDTATYKLVKDGENISLTVLEYKMLLYLIENKGRTITKEELLQNVWKDEFTAEGTLSVHARHLREKMEKDPKNPEIIKTVWGVGYMIEA